MSPRTEYVLKLRPRLWIHREETEITSTVSGAFGSSAAARTLDRLVDARLRADYTDLRAVVEHEARTADDEGWVPRNMAHSYRRQKETGVISIRFWVAKALSHDQVETLKWGLGNGAADGWMKGDITLVGGNGDSDGAKVLAAVPRKPKTIAIDGIELGVEFIALEKK